MSNPFDTPGGPEFLDRLRAHASKVSTPEMYRLLERLTRDPSRKLVGFNVRRGGSQTTPEEIAAAINRALDAAERGEFVDAPPKRVPAADYSCCHKTRLVGNGCPIGRECPYEGTLS